MLTTVIIGTCVSIQGNFVKRLSCGRVMVRVGEQMFAGRPVSSVQTA